MHSMSIVGTALAVVLTCLTTTWAAEPVSLFDGESVAGWMRYDGKAPGPQWQAKDGVLTLTAGGGGDIITKEKYGNFILEFEWRVQPGSNSGVMYRVRQGDKAPYFSGPEYQILDDSKHRDGKDPLTGAGALYALYAAEGKELEPVGEWNTSKLVVNGNTIEHWLNGTQVVAAEIGSDDWKRRIANSKFKKWGPFAKETTGHIALQDHGDPVSFRNLRITVLP